MHKNGAPLKNNNPAGLPKIKPEKYAEWAVQEKPTGISFIAR